MDLDKHALVVSANTPAPGETATQRLLAAAKRRAGIPSNYRLARELGLSDNTLTRWNQGRGSPADPIAIQLAEMAGLDVGLVLVELAAERAQDDDTRARLLGVVERLRHAGLAAIMGFMVALGAPSPEAQASEVQAHVDPSGLCVMSTQEDARMPGNSHPRSKPPQPVPDHRTTRTPSPANHRDSTSLPAPTLAVEASRRRPQR